jgi:hypothetical protein
MDLTTLLVIGLIVVVVVMLLSRNRGFGAGGSPIYGDRTGGVDRPTYDDPGYTGASRPTHDDPNYRSGGSIG